MSRKFDDSELRNVLILLEVASLMGKEDVYGWLVHHYVSQWEEGECPAEIKTSSFSPFTLLLTQQDRQTLKPGTQKQFGNLMGEIKILLIP